LRIYYPTNYRRYRSLYIFKRGSTKPRNDVILSGPHYNVNYFTYPLDKISLQEYILIKVRIYNLLTKTIWLPKSSVQQGQLLKKT